MEIIFFLFNFVGHLLDNPNLQTIKLHSAMMNNCSQNSQSNLNRDCQCLLGFEKTAEGCVKRAFLKVNPERSYLKDGLYLTGITSNNCSSLKVRAYNRLAPITGSNVENYEKGDTTFGFEVSENLGNVAVGMNCYFFIAECEGGQKVMDMVMLEYKKSVKQP